MSTWRHDEMPDNEGIVPRSATLPVEIAGRLRAAIQSGEIVGADGRLPAEAELAKRHGVSRPVIREAIFLLKSDGLVISHQGRGQFVNPAGSSVFRLEPALSNDADLGELFEFLLSVEVSATRLAAQRRTADDLATIRACFTQLHDATRDGESGVDEDKAFHRAIIDASHNRYFIEFAGFLDARVRRMIRIARKNTRNRSDELVWQVHAEHEAIMRALEAGDADRASAAASTHLRNAAVRLAVYSEP